MAAAESLWGISVSEQKRAKASGCAAFKGSRVFREPLLEWLKTNPPAPGAGDGDNLRAAKLAVQIKLLENQLARERGELVDRGLVREFCGALVADIFSILSPILDRPTFNAVSAELRAKIGKRGEVGLETL
jgi:hypothetical protein